MNINCLINKSVRHKNMPQISPDKIQEIKNGIRNLFQEKELLQLFVKIYNHNSVTAIHSIRVAILSYLVMPEQEILKAGLFHDIGKVCIDNKILNKPGALTDEEFNIIKKHPDLGLSIKETKTFKHIIKDAIVHHHENLDGTGYHKKTDIDRYARVIRITDSYDAMTGGRPYNPGIPKSEAVQKLAATSDLYDKDYLKTFKERIYE